MRVKRQHADASISKEDCTHRLFQVWNCHSPGAIASHTCITSRQSIEHQTQLCHVLSLCSCLWPVPTARKRVLPLSRSCMRQPLDLCQVRPATALLYSNSLPCHDTGWAVDMTCHERVMNVSWTCHGHKRIFTFRVNSCPVLPQPSLLLLHSCC